MSDVKKGRSRSGKAVAPASKRPSDGVQTENEQLKQRIKQLEEELDTYRKAVYAWAREQFQPEDFRRAAAEKDGLPLSAFIDQFQREAHGS